MNERTNETATARTSAFFFILKPPFKFFNQQSELLTSG
jgi:hypothetical protein